MILEGVRIGDVGQVTQAVYVYSRVPGYRYRHQPSVFIGKELV